MKTITKQQARQFILSKQGLTGAYRFIRKDGAYEYVRQAGCIQYDPVDVCGRNAELTLQSRVKGFRKTMLQEIIEGQHDLKPRMSFLAPLDPLLWDKALILALWDYRYSWEIYTPAVKRKFGYYTLPVLFGERFVGRIEAVPDRKEQILTVKGLWWEPDVRVTKKMSAALDRTLREFGKFNDCRTVESSVKKKQKSGRN